MRKNLVIGIIQQGLRYFKILGVLTCLLLSNLVKAELAVASVVVLMSSDAVVYQSALSTLRDEIKNERAAKHVLMDIYLSEAQLIADHKLLLHADLIVTVGSAAANFALKELQDKNIISVFITRNAYQSIIADSNLTNRTSAIFIDQPVERLMNLTGLLNVDQDEFNVGLLSDRKIKYYKSNNKIDVNVNAKELSPSDNPTKIIEPLIISNDVLVVLPGGSYFNQLVAKLVLQLSMKHKKPVIGFSKKYAEAGALLSLYSSPPDIGLDSARMVNAWLADQNNKLPLPHNGRFYSIKMNEKIARRLNKSLDAEKLKIQLGQLYED